MRKRTLLFLILLFSCLMQAAEDLMRFRIYLKDKQSTAADGYAAFRSSDEQPGMGKSVPELSQVSIQRRQNQGISFDHTDYPVSATYLKILREKNFPVVTQSRWMNTVVVSAPDSSCLDTLLSLSFVKSVQLVWRNPSKEATTSGKMALTQIKSETDSSSIYGKADAQIHLLNLDLLHHQGYQGANKMIAVIDGGFYGVDSMFWFKKTSLVAVRDFIYPASSIYKGHPHGTSVLSIMAANEKYAFMGAAPAAKYCLLRTEDIFSEFPIEEDYWAAAAEFADSIGADIISSSLGYSEFDMAELSYRQSQLDGNTAFVTRAASMAASKGILVVCSAGNDGAKPWQKISFPADSKNVLTVGSVQPDLFRCSFSSVGPTADGRIKPDVMALGSNLYIVNGSGDLTVGNGTSFSTPLIAGMAACLWEAFPHLKASEIMQVIKEGGNRALNPDSLYGFGIPDIGKVMLTLGASFPRPGEKMTEKKPYMTISPLSDPVGILLSEKKACFQPDIIH
ncbi:MAG: S8 family serine peptidase [Bacteroidales bacterium]|nr:S8 family serine peptidase [Bacteroidales bacterium]